MDDTDGQEKHALDLQIQALQLVRSRQTQSFTPFAGLVDFSCGGLRVEQLLQEAGGREADADTNRVTIGQGFGGEFA